MERHHARVPGGGSFGRAVDQPSRSFCAIQLATGFGPWSPLQVQAEHLPSRLLAASPGLLSQAGWAQIAQGLAVGAVDLVGRAGDLLDARAA